MEVIHDLQKVPVIRLLIPFIGGIFLGFNSPSINSGVLFSSCTSLLIISILTHLWAINSGKLLHSIGFGISIISLGIICAILSLKSDLGENKQQLDGVQAVVSGRILAGELEKPNSVMIKLRIERVLVDSVAGLLKENLQIYLPADSLTPHFVPGEHYIFFGRFKAIQNRGNPGEFDYRSYMLRRNYHYSFFVFDDAYRQIKTQGNMIRYMPSRIRERIQSSWDMSDRDIADRKSVV